MLRGEKRRRGMEGWGGVLFLAMWGIRNCVFIKSSRQLLEIWYQFISNPKNIQYINQFQLLFGVVVIMLLISNTLTSGAEGKDG